MVKEKLYICKGVCNDNGTSLCEKRIAVYGCFHCKPHIEKSNCFSSYCYGIVSRCIPYEIKVQGIDEVIECC